MALVIYCYRGGSVWIGWRDDNGWIEKEPGSRGPRQPRAATWQSWVGLCPPWVRGAGGRRASGTPCHTRCMSTTTNCSSAATDQKHQTRAARERKTASPLPRLVAGASSRSAWFGNCAHWRSTERGFLSADRIVNTYM